MGRGDPLPDKVKSLRPVMKRLSGVPGSAGFRGRVAASVVFGKVFYGLEGQRVTEGTLRSLRGLMASGIFQRLGLRNAAAALLLLEAGRFDPVVVYAKRLFRSWVRTLGLEDLPEDYLRAMPGMRGWRGPLQKAYSRFRTLRVRMKGAACWVLRGREYRIGATHGLEAALVQAAQDREWARLAVQRAHYAGLQTGRDALLSDGIRPKLASREEAMLAYLQADGVYTPGGPIIGRAVRGTAGFAGTPGRIGDTFGVVAAGPCGRTGARRASGSPAV